MTGQEQAADCAHPDFDAQCIVTRLEDTGLFSMDVKVWCSACAKPFEFPDSIPMGLDLYGVARSLSGQELRIAIKPSTWPDDWADPPRPAARRPTVADVDGTYSVGYVHVLTEPGGPCVTGCPHPDHEETPDV